MQTNSTLAVWPLFFAGFSFSCMGAPFDPVQQGGKKAHGGLTRPIYFAKFWAKLVA